MPAGLTRYYPTSPIIKSAVAHAARPRAGWAGRQLCANACSHNYLRIRVHLCKQKQLSLQPVMSPHQAAAACVVPCFFGGVPISQRGRQPPASAQTQLCILCTSHPHSSACCSAQRWHGGHARRCQPKLMIIERCDGQALRKLLCIQRLLSRSRHKAQPHRFARVQRCESIIAKVPSAGRAELCKSRWP